MTPANKDLARLLRLIAEIAESDQPDLVSIVYASAKQARSTYTKGKKGAPTEPPDKLEPISNEELLKLEEFENREDLNLFLRRAYPRRADLANVAKALRLSMNKTSNYDEIVDKVIDATVGYRLRSRAIRGE